MCNIVNVLCVCDYFLPGYLGGGPITTLANMRSQLKGHVSIAIFTRDRDLGASAPYQGIKVNQWNETPDGQIYYASPENFGGRGVLEALKSNKFDIIYLNSFFSSKGSIFPLISFYRLASRPRVLLATRGEFSTGALAIKRYKKKFFLTIARLFDIYDDVFWHASTPMEAEDIIRIFPKAEADGRIFVAVDPIFAELSSSELSVSKKETGRLRIAFISRISPKKNIDGLLKILATVSANVQLDIFGPIEDKTYWKQCTELIAHLPVNIQVAVNGPVSPDSIINIFSQYDLFAFPTHGENFGHVIFEALCAGTPVLLSDQTPWQSDDAGAVSVIPLNDTSGWRDAIEQAANRCSEVQDVIRIAARNYAIRYAKEANTKQNNLDLFLSVLSY